MEISAELDFTATKHLNFPLKFTLFISEFDAWSKSRQASERSEVGLSKKQIASEGQQKSKTSASSGMY